MNVLTRMIALLVVLGLAAWGCGDGGGTEDDTTTDEGPDTAADTEEDTPDDTTPPDTPDEELPTGDCGNGTIDSGEVCDDGNTVTEFCSSDASACLADCSLANAECGDGSPDEGEQCDDGNSDSEDSCTTSCTENTGDFGDPCHCEGSGCSALDFTAGTIVGCGAIASLEDSTRTLACMTTGEDTTYAVQVYGAGGYCMLMALGCEGILCGVVPTTGDIDAIVCPAGTAVATDVRSVAGMTITTKTCQQLCSSQADCRWNEADDSTTFPWAGDCGQWECVPGGDGGEMVCADVRNVE